MNVPEPGETFEERYELYEVLGAGGFARVFRARDLSVQREVALKVLWPSEEGYDAAVAARFMREARVVAELQDPHTITLYDYGERADGLLWMACEFVSGQDLADVLRAQGQLDPAVTLHIVRQLCSSLREAHGRGVLHRDIKPANILVHEYAGDPYGVKLIDFGLAKSWTSTSTEITAAGRITGTPRYMSPEQIFGAALDPRTDIYSLGLVVYEMLVGRPAIEGSTTEQLIREQAAGAPTKVPRELAPEALCTLIEQMTQRDASLRPRNIEHVEQTVRGLLRAQRSRRTAPIPGAPPPVDQPSTEEATIVASSGRRRRDVETAAPPIPRWQIGAGVVVVVLLALAVFSGLWEEPALERPVTKRSVEALVAAPAVDPVEVRSPTSEDAGGGDPRCAGREHISPGVQKIEMFRGLRREALLAYIPEDYDPRRPHPTIWFFHDFAAPETVLKSLDFRAVDDLQSFVILAPQGNSMTLWDTVGEFEAASELLEAAHDELCLDREQFFVWGHGFGGRVATRVAMCSADVAAVATTNYRERFVDSLCEPDPVNPYLHVGVRNDPTAPATGGRGCLDHILELRCERKDRRCGRTPSLESHERFFSKRHGCQGGKQAARGLDDKRCLAAQSCDTTFVSCVARGGRPLPGVPQKNTTCASKAADFPYLRTVFQFFSQHDRAPAAEP